MKTKLGEDFPDENQCRKKLGKPPIKTPVKAKKQSQKTMPERQHHHSPLDEVPVQDKPRKKPKKIKSSKAVRKPIRLTETQKVYKGEIDTIVENINLINTMIDAADPKDRSSLELVIDLVGDLRTTESQLIETISNVDQPDLVDYAIKVNDDRQATITRFKQLQKGRRPSKFRPSYVDNKFDNPPVEEEVKLDVSEDSVSQNSHDR